MRAGELDAELVQPVFVAFDVFKLGKSLRRDACGLSVGLHLSGGGKVVVIGRVELVEEVKLARSGELRGLLVNPLVELDAVLLELIPCRRVAPGGVAEQEVVQGQQPLLEFFGKPEASQLRGGQFAFELRDAPPGILNAPKRQASHQSDSPDQHRHAQAGSGVHINGQQLTRRR